MVAPHKDSSSLSLSFYDESGDLIEIRNSQVPIVLNLPTNVQLSALDMPVLVHAAMSTTNQDLDLFYHSRDVNSQVGTLNVELVPLMSDVQLAVYIRYDDFPDIATENWDAFGLVPRKMAYLSKSDAANACIHCLTCICTCILGTKYIPVITF